MRGRREDCRTEIRAADSGLQQKSQRKKDTGGSQKKRPKGKVTSESGEVDSNSNSEPSQWQQITRQQETIGRRDEQDEDEAEDNLEDRVSGRKEY